jgi:hypothetical protein
MFGMKPSCQSGEARVGYLCMSVAIPDFNLACKFDELKCLSEQFGCIIIRVDFKHEELGCSYMLK